MRARTIVERINKRFGIEISEQKIDQLLGLCVSLIGLTGYMQVIDAELWINGSQTCRVWGRVDDD
jgi:Mg2+/Co2+ transporter CorC